MFAPLLVEVKSVGEDVTLAIGTWTKRLHFETAVLLATWLDECAREAKEWANVKRRLRGVGTMHDASDHKWLDRGQPFTLTVRLDRTLLKAHDIHVTSEGGTVVLIAGTTQAAMPHEAAIRISQFIRLKARESQMRAGDTTRHWSKIVQHHAEQHG